MFTLSGCSLSLFPNYPHDSTTRTRAISATPFGPLRLDLIPTRFPRNFKLRTVSKILRPRSRRPYLEGRSRRNKTTPPGGLPTELVSPSVAYEASVSIGEAVKGQANTSRLTHYDSLPHGSRDAAMIDSTWCLDASASTRYHMMAFRAGLPWVLDLIRENDVDHYSPEVDLACIILKVCVATQPRPFGDSQRLLQCSYSTSKCWCFGNDTVVYAELRIFLHDS